MRQEERMTEEQMIGWLREEAEEKYRDFSSSLLPGVPKEKIMGVRIPKLRKLAATIVREGCGEYLQAEPGNTFEEIMLCGMVIGRAGGTFEEILPRIQEYLPLIDNWSVCDSFCASLKTTEKYPEKMWEFLLECLKSDRTYTVRFAVVMMLQYYVNEKYLKQVLARMEEVETEEYYVRMAVAWAVSVCYVKAPEEVLGWLAQRRLDEETWKKALQKILESRRLPAGEKERIRKLRSVYAESRAEHETTVPAAARTIVNSEYRN